MPLELNKKSKMYSLAWIFILIGLLLILYGARTSTMPRAGSQGLGYGTSNVTRSIVAGGAYVDANATIRLTITPGPKTLNTPECGTDPACNDYYVLTETIPDGATYLSITDPFCDVVTTSTPNKIHCIMLRDTSPRTVEYQVLMPSLIAPSTTRIVNFNGKFMFQGDGIENTVGGTGSVLLIKKNQLCTPNWSISSWGAWSNLTDNCGIRTRSVIDLNTCGIDTDKPETTQTVACPTGAICQNHVREAGEICDGQDVGGKTCKDINVAFLAPGLGCLPSCLAFDPVNCTLAPLPTNTTICGACNATINNATCGSCSSGDNGGGGTPPPDKTTCKEDWRCTDWTACLNGITTRSCDDFSECDTTKYKPEEASSCTTPITYSIYIAIGVSIVAVGILLYVTRRKPRTGSRGVRRRSRR